MENDFDDIQGVFFFDPKDRIYPDHFPGSPVVPGSVIIHSFYSAAHQAGLLSCGLSIDRFRFKSFVSPGEYEYRIQVRKEDIICALYKGKEIMAEGRLKR
jgi:3-hydroxyacyl-[acyl-carrier-protein] dehydratase